jgi:hypothetical protein
MAERLGGREDADGEEQGGEAGRHAHRLDVGAAAGKREESV